MFSIVTVLLNAIILVTGVVSSITDFCSGKIYNRILSVATVIGGIAVIGYLLMSENCIWRYSLNLLAGFILGYSFYRQKVWGAGDAKLWILIVFLFPYHQYFRNEYMLFPSVYILMTIFLMAYGYVIIESLFCVTRKGKRDINTSNKFITKEILFQWIFSFLLVSIISKVLQIILMEYFFQNQIFFSVIFLVFIQWLSNKKIVGKEICTFALGLIYFTMECFNRGADPRQYLINGIIVFTVLLIGRFGAKYNYKEIATNEVKEGMIMSQIAVLSFQASRVKKLPVSTDETTKSRITKEEAEAIRRWKDSKYGKESVVIISILPFAVFELVGTFIYLVMSFLA